MWLFSKAGFISVVKHRDQPGMVMVRARLKEDIEAIRTLLDESDATAWQVTPDADYRFRLVCSQKAFAAVAAKLVSQIDYDNFKNAVHGNPVRDRAYMRCWSAMNEAQRASLKA